MSTSVEFFKGRKAVIATKHSKETVMQPLLNEHLGIDCFTIPGFDTDVFGTFAGEVERVLSPIDTLRAKINAALDMSQQDLGFGNEGSFGPHPQIPFIPCGLELVMMIDRKHKLEIVASNLTTETNFRQETINNIQALETFLQSIDFPSHAVILKQENNAGLKKGINNWEDLYQASQALGLETNALIAEPDMRALFNPTRMETIKATTQMLVDKILQQCPECHMPGFGDEQKISGLPCEWCGEATDLMKQKIIVCQHCQYQVSYEVDQKASPMYCNQCNP